MPDTPVCLFGRVLVRDDRVVSFSHTLRSTNAQEEKAASDILLFDSPASSFQSMFFGRAFLQLADFHDGSQIAYYHLSRRDCLSTMPTFNQIQLACLARLCEDPKYLNGSRTWNISLLFSDGVPQLDSSHLSQKAFKRLFNNLQSKHRGMIRANLDKPMAGAPVFVETDTFSGLLVNNQTFRVQFEPFIGKVKVPILIIDGRDGLSIELLPDWVFTLFKHYHYGYLVYYYAYVIGLGDEFPEPTMEAKNDHRLFYRFFYRDIIKVLTQVRDAPFLVGGNAKDGSNDDNDKDGSKDDKEEEDNTAAPWLMPDNDIDLDPTQYKLQKVSPDAQVHDVWNSLGMEDLEACKDELRYQTDLEYVARYDVLMDFLSGDGTLTDRLRTVFEDPCTSQWLRSLQHKKAGFLPYRPYSISWGPMVHYINPKTTAAYLAAQSSNLKKDTKEKMRCMVPVN